MDLNALAHRWFEEVWNQGREDTIDELYSADCISHGLGEGGAGSQGLEGFKIYLRNMRSAMSDVRVTVEDTIVQGDKVVARLRLVGTHDGPGLGMPATHRRVSVSAISIARVDGDGKVVEGWNNWDQFGFLQQIGVLPPAPGPDRFLSAR